MCTFHCTVGTTNEIVVRFIPNYYLENIYKNELIEYKTLRYRTLRSLVAT